MVFLFTVVTSPFVVLFGPFNNVKRAVIGAILQSRHPHYITWLFNEEEHHDDELYPILFEQCISPYKSVKCSVLMRSSKCLTSTALPTQTRKMLYGLSPV